MGNQHTTIKNETTADFYVMRFFTTIKHCHKKKKVLATQISLVAITTSLKDVQLENESA